MKDLTRVIRWVGELLVILTAIIAIAWAFGAVLLGAGTAMVENNRGPLPLRYGRA